jgi:hypothetical protein
VSPNLLYRLERDTRSGNVAAVSNSKSLAIISCEATG